VPIIYVQFTSPTFEKHLCVCVHGFSIKMSEPSEAVLAKTE
jgi:hypothetical protein